MSDSVMASHILLMYRGSMRSTASRTKEDALAKMEEMKVALDKGADFADLARTNSDCPSGEEGGNLGLFGRGEMVPEFEAAAFGLPVGGVSGVFETSFGYHIVKRTR
ncbi:MAG: peptidyl-prolyl cis-trans isomerase [Magnetospirillum sp. WYHS-4]